MLEVYRAAEDVQARCRSQGWRFCLIGGIALQRWGEPRETIDVEGIVSRQAGRLDWIYTLGQLEPLAELKGEPEILTRLAELRSRLDTDR